MDRTLYKYNLDLVTEKTKALDNGTALFDPDQKGVMKSFHPVMSVMSIEEAEQSIAEFGRFVDYKEAPGVKKTLVYKYLYYFRQLGNLFDLEYFRSKLAAKAKSIVTLEQSVMSGLPFWESKDDDEVPIDNEGESEEEENDGRQKVAKPQVPYSQQKEQSEFRNKLADKVV